ncbi:F-box only protein 6 isoform X2 [Physcomitrium patens]|uniref:F-box only protein 6 isoform X2 n=1 Tax=Physcomitrium patens TaxID=3218 RepID=UPI003CCD7BD3
MGAVASTSEDIQMVAMDESVWKSLPEDLMERVLAWLPIHSLFRMRCVCKQWNSILFSERFVARYTQVSPQKPWIIMYTAGRVSSAYDSSLKKWHDLAIPAMSPEKCVLAASEGLLCYGNEFFPWPNLFVCNPMTKFWQHLPPMRFIKTIHVVGMVNDRASKSYKILVAGLFFDEAHNGRLATEIFCSQTNAWAVGGKPWPIMAAAWKLGAGYAVWSMESSPAAVFDLEDRTWKWLPGCPRLPDINNWQLRGISFEPQLDSFSQSSWGKDIPSSKNPTLDNSSPERKAPTLLSDMTVGADHS